MKLSPLFASHMVFAAGRPVRVFGTGAGEVTVSLAGVSRSTVSEGENWLVELPPMEYGGPHELTVSLNGEISVFEDVYIGEVILFAGQSNMQIKLREVPFAGRESQPMARLFTAERIEKAERFHPADGWVPLTAENAGDWSAIAYHTALELTARKGIAVGAVGCWQGASIIESWVPAGTFEANGIYTAQEERNRDHTRERHSAWNGDGILYEYMFSQIKPFPVSAVVWYQGESDTSPAEGKVYADELCLLIDRWRKDLMDEELPFVVVQIADYDPRPDEGWKLVQQAQLNAAVMRPAVRTVISADVCESDEIHPPTKELLSRRIVSALCEMGDGEFARGAEVSLRRLRPDDIGTLYRWLSDDRVTRWAWAEGVPWDFGKVKEEFADVCGADGTRGCIVSYRGEAIGYLQFYRLEPDSYKLDEAFFDSLTEGYGIDFFIGIPELWDKGIGSAAVELASAYLKSQGGRYLCADPETDNPRSLHLWPKNSFEPVCEAENYDDPDKTSLICVKKL